MAHDANAVPVRTAATATPYEGEGMEKARRAAGAVQRASLRAFLGLVWVYLCLGNLPRLIPLRGISHNVSVTEYLLYLASTGACLVNPGMLRAFLIRWFAVVWVVVASFAYGVLTHGFQREPALYAARLLLLLFSGFTAGCALFRTYGGSLERVLRFLLGSFVVVAFIGLVIFYVFPDLPALWLVLSEHGVRFAGDPHHRRFVSTFFDPSFYSVTGTLYVLMAFILWRLTGRSAYAVVAVILLTTILLTGSRSGIGTALLTLAGVAVQHHASVASVPRRLAIQRSTLRLLGLAGLGLVVALPVYRSSLETTMHRLSTMQEEGSARSRFESFDFGNELFSEHPLLGLGYNYLVPVAREFRGLSSLDSSVQVTLANFGMLLTLPLVVLLALWAGRTWRRLASWSASDPHWLQFHRMFILYLGVVIVFGCQFNNVLYYPLWLVPVVAVGTYLALIPRKERPAQTRE